MLLLPGPKCSVGAAKPRQNTCNPHLVLQHEFGTAEGRKNMTTTPETSLEVNAGSLRACTACAKQGFYSLDPKAALVQPNQGKHTQSTVGSPGPIWHCRGAQNHDNDTGVVARGQHWSITRTHRVCKAEFPLLGPHCPVGESKPRQNTHNPQLALQGPFGTAEGRETMTTTP